MRNKLKNWKTVIDTLGNPTDRPNDFERLVLECMSRGLNTQDTQRIFGIGTDTAYRWRRKYGGTVTEPDKTYFMRRARALGADDETIAVWFGFDRADKVSMLLAQSV